MPKKNALILFLISDLVAQMVYSQNRVLDSLQILLLNHPTEDSIQVEILNELSFRILKNQPKQSLAFAEKALALAQRLKLAHGIGEAKNNLSNYHQLRGAADVALKEAFEAAEIGERNHFPDLIANSYAILGTIYHNQLAYEKALHYLKLAEKFNTNEKNALIESRILNTRGLIAS